MSDTRVRAAVIVAVVGLLIPATLAGIMVAGKASADDLIKIINPFLTVVGTLVGAFLGVQVAASGKEDAEKRAASAEAKKDLALASMSPADAVPIAMR